MKLSPRNLVARLLAIDLVACVATGLLVVAFAPRLLLLVARGVALPEGARALRGYVDRLRQRESIRRLEGL